MEDTDSQPPMIPEDLFGLFASHPFGTDEIRRIAAAPESSLHNVLLAFLSSIPSQSVEVMQKNEHFRQLYGNGMATQTGARTIERIARLEIARGFLVDEACRRRLCCISERRDDARPLPYCMRALEDLCVGHDHLVPLVAFEYDGSRLLRNDFAFTVLSTTASPNSTYWLLGTFYEHGIDSEVAIRLDPLLFGRAQTFPRPSYFMKVYGRPLDWNRIEQLRDEDHGLWLPSNLIPWVEFTDYCWARRSPDEVHFTCEEVPKLAHVGTSASRYFHAVYSVSTRRIIHMDGALRVYSPAQLKERLQTHVRRAGKVGCREKVFRIDAPIDRSALSDVAQAFFVWNEDATRYFSNDIAIA